MTSFMSVNLDGWARCRGCGKADRHVRSVLISDNKGSSPKWRLLHYWCEPQFDESRLVRGRRPRKEQFRSTNFREDLDDE